MTTVIYSRLCLHVVPILACEENLNTCRSFAVILVISGMVASMTTVGVRVYAVFSAYFMIITGGFLIVILPMLAPVLQKPSFVFGEFFSYQATDLGIPSTT